MKYIFLLIAFAITFCSCKKSESDPGTTTPSKTNKMTATIGGTTFNGTTFSGYNSGFVTAVTAHASYSVSYPSISISLFAVALGKAGTYSITNGPPYECSATYQDAQGNYWTGLKGTINVTRADTDSYSFSDFEATFNFDTDTVSGEHYSITNGSVVYHD